MYYVCDESVKLQMQIKVLTTQESQRLRHVTPRFSANIRKSALLATAKTCIQIDGVGPTLFPHFICQHHDLSVYMIK